MVVVVVVPRVRTYNSYMVLPGLVEALVSTRSAHHHNCAVECLVTEHIVISLKSGFGESFLRPYVTPVGFCP